MGTLPNTLLAATVGAICVASLGCGSSSAGTADDSAAGTRTPRAASPVATTDPSLAEYARDVTASLQLAHLPSQQENEWADTEPQAQAVLDALANITPPLPIRGEHEELTERVRKYIRVFDSYPIEVQSELLRPYLRSWAMDTYEACLGVQRALTDATIAADIGCDDASQRIVLPCLTQRIPNPRLTEGDADEARTLAEQAVANLSWPDLPPWVARYGVSPITLYSPLTNIDGDPVFRDTLRDPRSGVAVWFGDRRGERIMRVTYAPVPSCDTSPVYVRQIEGVEVTNTVGRWAIERDADELYEMVTGEFVLPSVAVSMEFAYDRALAPSEDDRAEQFRSWARNIITAAGLAR